MSARRGVRAAVAGAGAALAAIAAALAVVSPYGDDRWLVLSVVVSVALPFAAGAVLLERFPDRRLGWITLAVGVAYFVRAGVFADSAVVYSGARALGPATGVLLGWLMLAFPTGRLGSRGARVTVLAGVASVVLLWWPVVALTPELPAGGEAFAVCGARCPKNVLAVADRPVAAAALAGSFRACAALLLILTASILALRLVRATRLMRRILAPVLISSIARTAAVGAYLVLGSPELIRGLLIVTYWATLASIAIGLLRGRSYDAAALERLVQGIRRRPSPAALQSVMARSLADPTLEIAYWMPQVRIHTDAGGAPLALPAHGSGRALTPVADSEGRHIATLVHDPALLDHPELLDAVASTSSIALESSRLEAEMAAARGGVIAAVDEERRRIERDLHDGAQQRLIALRMKLGAARHLLDRDVPRASSLLEELGGDVDAALAELRALAHGKSPLHLAELGLAGALAAVAREAPLPVCVRAEHAARYTPAVETAVYFACLEAIQNAVKHAGADARVEVMISDDGDALHFMVSDGGRGFDADTSTHGAGLGNMRARIAALGGSLTLESRAGGGTRLSGTIPL